MFHVIRSDLPASRFLRAVLGLVGLLAASSLAACSSVGFSLGAFGPDYVFADVDGENRLRPRFADENAAERLNDLNDALALRFGNLPLTFVSETVGHGLIAFVDPTRPADSRGVVYWPDWRSPNKQQDFPDAAWGTFAGPQRLWLHAKERQYVIDAGTPGRLFEVDADIRRLWALPDRQWVALSQSGTLHRGHWNDGVRLNAQTQWLDSERVDEVGVLGDYVLVSTARACTLFMRPNERTADYMAEGRLAFAHFDLALACIVGTAERVVWVEMRDGVPVGVETDCAAGGPPFVLSSEFFEHPRWRGRIEGGVAYVGPKEHSARIDFLRTFAQHLVLLHADDRSVVAGLELLNDAKPLAPQRKQP